MKQRLNGTDARAGARAAAEDVFFGQIVMIWARWAVIAGAAVLVILSSSNDVGQLSTRMMVVVGLMALNFFLHGRFLMERPANSRLILIASMVDLAVITWMTVAWGGADYHSPYFIFLYPVVMAFALVFPPRLTVLFTAAAVGLYSIAVVGGGFGADLWGIQDGKVFVIRLVTIAAMGGLGTYYWRIQRSRRLAVAQR